MNMVSLSESRQGELWRRLGGVNDPELDEPVTEMGFIERAEISPGGAVEVNFRLPTYWCSPNFAFLMLEDIRSALEALSWKPAFRVTLQDHMFADEVNSGVAAGRSFSEIFGTLAEQTDLEALREKFRVKAFKRRQEAVILDLREAGIADSEIVRMSLAVFDALVIGNDRVCRNRDRYRAALAARWPSIGPLDQVIVGEDCGRIEVAALAAHLADLRSVRINMEFNGALCRGLKDTRYKEMSVIDGEPTLVDFIVGRVPARAEQTHTPCT
jgi:metal-sulfur cluster biosynthetic enzyme